MQQAYGCWTIDAKSIELGKHIREHRINPP